MNELNNTEKFLYVCPVCEKKFNDIIEYSEHLKGHAEEEKRRKTEEEKRRMADQKKFDLAKLEKLRTVYENATSEYFAAKKSFEAKYNEAYPNDWKSITDNLFDITIPFYRW